MKTLLWTAIAHAILVASLFAQDNATASNSDGSSRRQAPSAQPASSPHVTGEDADVESLRRDTERLRVLLNQMRSNLAFVQTSQTPLKHQFELEADAWQVIVDDMDQRLRKIEERGRR